MPNVAETAHDMIAGMTPTLRSCEFVFVTTKDPSLASSLHAIATFREDEGLSLIVPLEEAQRANLLEPHHLPMSCVTLKVYSSLDGVGLTRAVSAVLGDNDIPCNMVAAFHHDHVFVPSHVSERAMEVLTDLQETTAQKSDATSS